MLCVISLTRQVFESDQKRRLLFRISVLRCQLVEVLAGYSKHGRHKMDQLMTIATALERLVVLR